MLLEYWTARGLNLVQSCVSSLRGDSRKIFKQQEEAARNAGAKTYKFYGLEGIKKNYKKQ